MRRIEFKVPIYDWNVVVVTIYDQNDVVPLKQELDAIDAEQQAAEHDLYNVRRHGVDGGDTWWDSDLRKSLVIIFPWTSKAKFYEVLNHEKRHVVDRILENTHINDIEAAAYLDGYISKQIFTHLKELIT